MSRENEIMNFINSIADALGAEVIVASPEEMTEHFTKRANDGMKRAASEAKHCASNVKCGAEKCYNNIKNAAAEARYAEIKRNLMASGMTEEEADAAIIPYKERLEKEKAEAKAKAEREAKAKNDVVEQTLKAIASAYGYKIENAVRIDGVPSVDCIAPVNGRNTYCDVVYDCNKGFYVKTTANMAEVTESNGAAVMAEMQSAISLCKALNGISPLVWPEV